MLTLSYICLELHSGWTAQAHKHGDCDKVYLVHGHARAELSLLSGGENTYESLEVFQSQLENTLRLRGGHFDNLLEDHDYEMIVEKVSETFQSHMQHIFIRACGSVLVIAVLENYLPEDVEDLRSMLSTMHPTEVQCNLPALTPLSMSAATSDWNKIGEIAIFG